MIDLVMFLKNNPTKGGLNYRFYGKRGSSTPSRATHCYIYDGKKRLGKIAFRPRDKVRVKELLITNYLMEYTGIKSRKVERKFEKKLPKKPRLTKRQANKKEAPHSIKVLKEVEIEKVRYSPKLDEHIDIIHRNYALDEAIVINETNRTEVLKALKEVYSLRAIEIFNKSKNTRKMFNFRIFQKGRGEAGKEVVFREERKESKGRKVIKNRDYFSSTRQHASNLKEFLMQLNGFFNDYAKAVTGYLARSAGPSYAITGFGIENVV